MTKLSEEEIFQKWKPVLEKLGIIDIEKQNMLAKYAELHHTYKTTDAIFQQPGYILKDDVNTVLDNKKEFTSHIIDKGVGEDKGIEGINGITDYNLNGIFQSGNGMGFLPDCGMGISDNEKIKKFRNEKCDDIKEIYNDGKCIIQLTNYLLYDFNNEKFKNYSKENIDNAVTKFIDKTNKIGICYGEMGHPINLDITFKNISHSLKNIKTNDKKISADITINNLIAQELFKSGTVEFAPRYTIDANKNLTLYSFDMIPKIIKHKK